MRKRTILALLALSAGLALSTPAQAVDYTKCEMTFTLDGWSIFYKRADGEGTITCDNGQKAKV